MAHDTTKDQYGKPLKQGSGIAPKWVGNYGGIPLSPWVQQRIAEYRAYPSLTEADIARMLT